MAGKQLLVVILINVLFVISCSNDNSGTTNNNSGNAIKIGMDFSQAKEMLKQVRAIDISREIGVELDLPCSDVYYYEINRKIGVQLVVNRKTNAIESIGFTDSLGALPPWDPVEFVELNR